MPLLNLKNLSSKIEAQDIQQAISQRFPDHKYFLYNSYIFDWESDYLSVSESQYIYECEIKVSLNDFKKDFKKKEKHILLENKNELKKIPNKFFYACKRGLIPTIWLPSYAGLIEIDNTENGMIAEVLVNAPFLHREDHMPWVQPLLLDKFYHKYKRTEFENYELNNKVKILEGKLNAGI